MRNSKRQSPPTVRFLPKSRATKWLFLGDSITLGARHTHGRRDYTQMFSERVRYELRRPKDLILNAAVDSATAQDCLAGLDYILASFQPDITFLMIGMNDAAADRRIPIPQFKATLLAIVAKLRDIGADVVLQTPNPIVPELALPYRRKFGRIVDAIREVAEEADLPLIDHTRNWESIFHGEDQSLAVSYMCDGVHPNGFGHALLAEQVFVALGIRDATAPTCRSFAP